MKPKQFFYLLSFVLIALLSTAGYGYYLGTTYLNSQSAAYSKKLADRQIAQDKIDQIQDLKNQFKKLKDDIQLIETALPKTAQQTELTLQLQSIATQSGMSISQITFPTPVKTTGNKPGAKSAKKEPFQNYIANFSLEGSYSELQSFLQRQEQLNRYTNVTNLGIAKDQKSKNLVFTVNLYAYLMP